MQSSANTQAQKGATYVFSNCCEYLGMNILETGISKSYVFGNKYQYIKYPDNHNIDVFDNTASAVGDYQHKIEAGAQPIPDTTWNLISESDPATHDSVWIVHGEITLPVSVEANTTLKLMLGTQEIARQSFHNSVGTVQKSISVTSVGFIRKGDTAKLYLYTDNTNISVGNIRFRIATLSSQTEVPANF